MLTILATAEARTRQMAAVRAASAFGSTGSDFSSSRSWRTAGFGGQVVRSMRGAVEGVFAGVFAVSSIVAARISSTYRNINEAACRHTNKFSSALVVPAPRVSTVLNT